MRPRREGCSFSALWQERLRKRQPRLALGTGLVAAGVVIRVFFKWLSGSVRLPCEPQRCLGREARRCLH